MATAPGNPMDMIEKELTCSICLNLLREPKDLDCPHTFCFDCLKRYVQTNSTIECPECRHITIAPQGGLTNLKTNLRLKNLVENLIKGAGPRRSTEEIEVPICPNHPGERQHFFCVTCGVSVCQNCLVIRHPKPQHEIREWKELMEEEHKQTKNQELDDVERKLELVKDKAKQEVKSQVQHVIAEVITWEKEMEQNIETMYQKRMNILQEKRIEWNRSITSGMSKLSVQQDDNGLPHDMTILHIEPGQLNASSFGKLVTSENKKPIVSANQNQDGSSANKEPIASFTQKQVGSANREPVASANQKEVKIDRSKKLCLSLRTEFGCFSGVHCVAANKSYRIAVCYFQHMKLYGKDNGGKYRRECKLKLNDIMGPIVATSSQGEFFVVDSRQSGEVKIFSQAGKYERKWPKSVVGDVIAMIPYGEGEIGNSYGEVVIGSSSTEVIKIHQYDGELIKTHQVDCDRMGDIASNGKQIAFTTRDSVCVIDFVTGETLWTSSMIKPLGICYEHKTNTLLVSRCESYHNGIIEQYCSTTGRLISSLAGGLYFPDSMTVTQDNQLIVADLQTVKVYNVYPKLS